MRVVIVPLLLSAAFFAQADAPPSAQSGAPAVAAASQPGPAATPAVRTVTPEALLARQAAKDRDLVVVDVRTPEEFAAGHVPGAINVPHDQVESRLAELRGYRGKDVVVYCRSGRRSEMALTVLEKAGFERLGHLEGDMNAWSAAGRPIAK
jgi:rhodanese-related sulfurtransferase